jgi:branched-chain amino acid transport system substrate-binding protein
MATLAACGDEASESTRVHGDTLTIYASLPAHGVDAAAGRAAEAGMRRALADAGGRVGGRRVELVRLSSTRPGDEYWDPGTVEANAERAAEDPTAIAYLGELNQGGSAVSLPVTNGRGILQVAPADGLTSFTRTPPGRPRAGPERYYPGERRTFVRLVPSDILVAQAIVGLLREAGTRRLAVVHGNGIADRELEAMVLAIIGEGVPRTVVRVGAGEGSKDDVAEIVDEVRGARPEALLYAGPAGVAAMSSLRAVAARLPGLPVFGGPALAPAAGAAGLPVDGCAVTGVPTPPLLPPRGRAKLAQLRRAVGGPVGGEGVLGYEAMRLVLDAIAVSQPDRLQVAKAARRPTWRDGVLGTYRFSRRGDVAGPALACLELATGGVRKLAP